MTGWSSPDIAFPKRGRRSFASAWMSCRPHSNTTSMAQTTTATGTCPQAAPKMQRQTIVLPAPVLQQRREWSARNALLTSLQQLAQRPNALPRRPKSAQRTPNRHCSMRIASWLAAELCAFATRFGRSKSCLSALNQIFFEKSEFLWNFAVRSQTRLLVYYI